LTKAAGDLLETIALNVAYHDGPNALRRVMESAQPPAFETIIA
jgi:hypothetical protein